MYETLFKPGAASKMQVLYQLNYPNAMEFKENQRLLLWGWCSAVVEASWYFDFFTF